MASYPRVVYSKREPYWERNYSYVNPSLPTIAGLETSPTKNVEEPALKLPTKDHTWVSFNPNIANLANPPYYNPPAQDFVRTKWWDFSWTGWDTPYIPPAAAVTIPVQVASYEYLRPQYRDSSWISFNPNIPVVNKPFGEISVSNLPTVRVDSYSYTSFNPNIVNVPNPPFFSANIEDFVRTSYRDYSYTSYNPDIVPAVLTIPIQNNTTDYTKLPFKEASWISFNPNIPVVTRPLNQYDWPLPIVNQHVEKTFTYSILPNLAPSALSGRHFLTVIGAGH